MENIIDLRSDTVTKPTKEMLAAMFDAEVGDDVFKEDPTILKLQNTMAQMFGKEAALFCPSGTMANQIAIKTHCVPGDEVICHEYAHVYKYEGGGMASNAGCSAKLLQGKRGLFDWEDVERAINPNDEHYPISKLVVVENTCNLAGGTCFKREDLELIAATCRRLNLKIHLDGARFFNALTAQKEEVIPYAGMFDTISICLSKGLGAPVGSVLIGTAEDIKTANRYRKALGGGMRQCGYLAAAGLYALENNIIRMSEDHAKAKELENVISGLKITKEVLPVETNIIIFEIREQFDTESIISLLKTQGILIVKMGQKLLRMVTHMDFSDLQLERVINILKTAKW